MARGSFYHGGKKPSWVLTLVVTALVLLAVLAVWLFFDLQKYIVYDKDGVSIAGQAQALAAEDVVTHRTLPTVDAEIVVDPTDYSAVPALDVGDLAPLRGRYLRSDAINEQTLTNYATAGLGDYNALVLQLKPASGVLCWHSSVRLADSYDVNGSIELAETAAKLKESGIWLVAELCALTDASMAVRNTPAALKNANGGVFVEDGMAWLDPYSITARDYLTALMRELKSYGFDEILFSGMYLPAGEDLRFSAAMTGTPEPASAVSSLSLYLRKQAEELGLRISVLAENSSFGSADGTDAASPTQDLRLFFKAFDRVAFSWDFGGESRYSSLLTAVTGGKTGVRVVPVSTGYVPQRESYIVK